MLKLLGFTYACLMHIQNLNKYTRWFTWDKFFSDIMNSLHLNFPMWKKKSTNTQYIFSSSSVKMKAQDIPTAYTYRSEASQWVKNTFFPLLRARTIITFLIPVLRSSSFSSPSWAYHIWTEVQPHIQHKTKGLKVKKCVMEVFKFFHLW